MPSSFNMENLPFSLLTKKEQALLRQNLDIGYFQKGEVIMESGSVPEGVHVVLKGKVSESETRDNKGGHEHVFVQYENEDYFGAWSAIKGKAIHNFIAEEETICHIIPTKTVLELVSGNSLFADYFQQNLTAKTEIVEQYGASQDMAEFMLARVSEGVMRDPIIVNEPTSIKDATALMREKKVDCVLVKKGSRYGMVTGTDILNAVVINELPISTCVAAIATYRLISVHPDDYLFNALIIMTQQQIERVVVMDNDELVGIVDLTDVLSFFSSHSHVIGLRIERARTLDDLHMAAQGLNDLIKSLVSQGVKARFAMDLLAAMNSRVMAKLFDLIVPADMQPHVCLIVMGSEGRGEQIMKTDQDNAIIYRDGLVWEDMHEVMNRFSEHLMEFGYPRCPGNIMVSNPDWVNSLGDWTQKMSVWSVSWTEADQMNLAIAVDAKPVAGNPALFKASRNWFFKYLKNNDAFLSNFAKVALEFNTPLTFFGNLKERGQLDVKKGGIFPIVHGVRTLALENRILATNTFKRLEALVKMGKMEEKHARDLSEALGLFIQLRLRQQIKRAEEQEAGVDLTPNTLDLQSMNKMDRDLLRDAFHIVKGFKKHLELHYHLGSR
jgi:CBS domain-containing protein